MIQKSIRIPKNSLKIPENKIVIPKEKKVRYFILFFY